MYYLRLQGPPASAQSLQKTVGHKDHFHTIEVMHVPKRIIEYSFYSYDVNITKYEHTHSHQGRIQDF